MYDESMEVRTENKWHVSSMVGWSLGSSTDDPYVVGVPQIMRTKYVLAQA